MVKNKKIKSLKSQSNAIDFKKYWFEIIVFLFSIIFLFYKINHFPTFADEANNVYWAWIINKGGSYMGYQDGAPPIFSYIVSFSMRVFDDPLFAGRIATAVFGIIGAIGIYLVCAKLYSKNAARVSAIFYLFSPFTFFYHRMALRDSVLLTFGIMVMVFSVYLILSNNPKYNFFYITGLVFSQIFGLLTKQHAMVFLIYPLIALFLANNKKSKLKTVALCYFLIFSAIFLFILVNKNASVIISYVLHGVSVDVYGPEKYSRNIEIITSSITEYFSLFFVLLLLFILVSSIKNKKYFDLLIVVYPIFSLITLIISPFIHTRWVLVFILPWFFAIGSSFDLFLKKIAGYKPKSYIVTSLILVGLFLPSINFLFYYFKNPANTPFTRIDKNDFIYSDASGFRLFEALDYLKGLSEQKPIFIVTEPGLGARNWPYILFEDNQNIKVAAWPGFRTTSLAKYINEPAYVILELLNSPRVGGHYDFKKVNPGAKLVKRFWRPGNQTYIDIMVVEQERKS